MVWATIVVQFNPIVQRLGDQAVRVGCTLSDREPPQPRNITVHSTFSFLDPKLVVDSASPATPSLSASRLNSRRRFFSAGVPPISSTIVNASTQAPSVTMRILDENARDAIVTHLGQKLTLKIQLSPANGELSYGIRVLAYSPLFSPFLPFSTPFSPAGPYDITAGHLVASSASGDASYLLLDEIGCPVDPLTFPALAKDPLDERSLVASFAAFKFPDSQLVRFNVIVRFCLEKCVPVS